jgi:hypothetical protein
MSNQHPYHNLNVDFVGDGSCTAIWRQLEMELVVNAKVIVGENNAGDLRPLTTFLACAIEVIAPK